MSLTLKELEARLKLLEEEMGQLRQKVDGPRVDETPAERGARILREAEADQPRIAAHFTRLFKEMGITDKPPSMAELRAMATEERRKAAQKKVRAKDHKQAG